MLMPCMWEAQQNLTTLFYPLSGSSCLILPDPWTWGGQTNSTTISHPLSGSSCPRIPEPCTWEAEKNLTTLSHTLSDSSWLMLPVTCTCEDQTNLTCSCRIMLMSCTWEAQQNLTTLLYPLSGSSCPMVPEILQRGRTRRTQALFLSPTVWQFLPITPLAPLYVGGQDELNHSFSCTLWQDSGGGRPRRT